MVNQAHRIREKNPFESANKNPLGFNECFQEKSIRGLGHNGYVCQNPWNVPLFYSHQVIAGKW